jgi:hypothetical protein
MRSNSRTRMPGRNGRGRVGGLTPLFSFWSSQHQKHLASLSPAFLREPPRHHRFQDRALRVASPVLRAEPRAVARWKPVKLPDNEEFGYEKSRTKNNTMGCTASEKTDRTRNHSFRNSQSWRVLAQPRSQSENFKRTKAGDILSKRHCWMV